ncbi:MAG TPA: cation transporter [Gaiellaceae bacterium]|nr:cation transporter [Gaiellaceae bacterium]
MATVTETLQVAGVRCERCVNRLAAALRGQDGLEYANANLMGQVVLEWDEERTTRDELLGALAQAGFREAPDGGE